MSQNPVPLGLLFALVFDLFAKSRRRSKFTFVGKNGPEEIPSASQQRIGGAGRKRKTLRAVLASGGEKYPMVLFPGEISYLCFKRVHQYI